MKQNKTTEFLVGIFIVAGLAALLVLAMQVSNLGTLHRGDSYQLKARFENIGGLKVRSAVTVSGVRVGRISDINFDNDRFEAVVTMDIENRYNQFPDDTAASIYTAGLLGEQYISLEPGGSDELLDDGSTIELTQSSLVLEKLISKFLFSKSSEGGQ